LGKLRSFLKILRNSMSTREETLEYYLENLKRACQPSDLVLEGEHDGVMGVLAILRDLARSYRARRLSTLLAAEHYD
jgi:hypothetical protein